MKPEKLSNNTQNTDWYKQVVDHLPIATILTNRDGGIIGANSFAQRLLGYNENELKELNFLQLVSYTLKGGNLQKKKKISCFSDIQLSYKAGNEYMVRKKNDAHFFAQLQYSQFSNGIAETIVWTITSYHAEKINTSELEKRVNEQLALLKVAKTICISTDFNSALKESLPYIRKAWQFPEHTLVRIRLDGGLAYTSEGFKETPCSISSTIQGSKKQYGTIEVFYTMEVPTNSDDPFWIDEKKLLDGLTNLFSIFLYHLSALDKLRENEKMIRKITSQIPANTYQFEIFEDGHIKVFFGSKGHNELMYDYTTEEVVKDPTKVIDLIVEEDRNYFYQNMRNAYKDHQDINMQYRVKHEDIIRWRWFRATPEIQDDGKVIWYASTQDVTPFIDYIDVLEQILSDISHVIRRPIATMLSLTDHIENATFSEADLKELSQTIRTVVKEMDDYTQKLNEVYKEKILNTSVGKMGFPQLIKRQRHFRS